ncbi:N-acetylmuramoyl-L-alanine amidase [Bacillus carboniphilus]|uniref:N-acetylmuramoyl-L-alanine amidase n=1 Tax=Bacillus carboniphilus TaxID=86663 RepID=A0ABY9JSR5_9BACI|nr:N-acetylmuramoyl-L-alanine amidase [Bacillus carboniphilus]WLR41460.1 N-acetylmuramoyl-L-alanine amidase [Bacillus carboniphilus]
MKICLDAGHGYETRGKRTPDGFKEYQFNRAVIHEMKKQLNYFDVSCYEAHSDQRDIPLKERTNKANKLNVDLYLSIHANAHGNGQEWTSANGIETFVYKSKPKKAFQLALQIQKHLVQETGRKDRGVKLANFHVLRETKMTAILCECGFMTNRQEATLLRKGSYQKTCATAIVKALVAFYHLKPVHNQKSLYKVQIGAFQSRSNAEKLMKRLTEDGYEAFIVKD